jgi:hypothetical protein
MLCSFGGGGVSILKRGSNNRPELRPEPGRTNCMLLESTLSHPSYVCVSRLQDLPFREKTPETALPHHLSFFVIVKITDTGRMKHTQTLLQR